MQTDHYAVLGNPVTHSKSPIIHMTFAKQTHQDIYYSAIEVPLDGFKQAVRDFLSQGGKGFNVTVPFKQQAFELVDQSSDRASIAKSVNTVKILPDGTLFGDNTDGLGLIYDLQIHQHYPLEGKRILILGAGGAVRGILPALLAQAPYEVCIANRTLANAQNLALEFSALGKIQILPLTHLQQTEHFDLIIQAASMTDPSSLSLLTDNLFTKNTFCYDLKYGQNPTPFLKWAQRQGAQKIADGIGMLVEQAAEAFYIWRGVRPATQNIIAALKSNNVTT